VRKWEFDFLKKCFPSEKSINEGKERLKMKYENMFRVLVDSSGLFA